MQIRYTTSDDRVWNTLAEAEWHGTNLEILADLRWTPPVVREDEIADYKLLELISRIRNLLRLRKF